MPSVIAGASCNKAIGPGGAGKARGDAGRGLRPQNDPAKGTDRVFP